MINYYYIFLSVYSAVAELTAKKVRTKLVKLQQRLLYHIVVSHSHGTGRKFAFANTTSTLGIILSEKVM